MHVPPFTKKNGLKAWNGNPKRPDEIRSSIIDRRDGRGHGGKCTGARSSCAPVQRIRYVDLMDGDRLMQLNDGTAQIHKGDAVLIRFDEVHPFNNS